MNASTCRRCHKTGYCDLDCVCARCSEREQAERERKERATKTIPCRDCGETGHDLGWWNRCAVCQKHHDLTAFQAHYGETLTRRIHGDRLNTKPPECDLCGHQDTRLVDGACPICRDRYGLDKPDSLADYTREQSQRDRAEIIDLIHGTFGLPKLN